MYQALLENIEGELWELIDLKNQEHRMSVQNVKGLADIVRQTKASLAAASSAAGEMQSTANSVTSKVAQINELTNELKQADAELGAAIGQLSNGGPPLDSTTDSAPITQTPLPAAQPISNVATDDTGTVIRPILSI